MQLLCFQTVEHGGCNQGAGLGADAVLRQELRPVFASFLRLRGIPTLVGQPAEVVLEHLTDVHTSRNAQRVQDDVHRCAIFQERQNLGDDALVSVTASHLVTNGDLAALSHVHAHRLAHAGVQIVFFVIELAHANDDALFTVWDTQAGVAHFARLLTEDGAQQALLTGQFGFTLRGDLADQDVAGLNLSTDANDAAFVKVSQ